jgi:hypothetical protein
MTMAPGRVLACRSRSGHPSRRERPVRAPRRARPLDDGTTEVVQVIEFVLPAGDAVQPVLWLDRHLLD